MSRLDRLLAPRTIAVFGGAQAAAVVEQTRKMGFDGEIWPVHPAREKIDGSKVYRSVGELPGAPDAAFVGVNRHLTVDIVRQLSARGAGGAVCFAAGFKETDDREGASLQAELIDAAGAMPIIGPNCYGLINYADGALLWPDQHGGRRLAAGERGAAIITQSSNIAINITMQRRGLPVAFMMTAGNQAQTGLSEMAIGLMEDERVSVLGLHIEAFDSVAGFEALARRSRELKKPIVAMKVGRSAQARAATVSHTASLAGADVVSDAFLKRLGIARVNSIPSFLEALKLLHVAGPLPGFDLSSMSCSGGEASLMADAAVGRRVQFPPLEAAHAARVKTVLGPLVAPANPLDYHTFIWNDEPAMTAAFSAFAAGGFDLNLLVLDFPRADRCSDADWWPTVRAFHSALDANRACGAVIASLPENLPEEYAAGMLAAGITPLSGITEALDAAEAAASIGETWCKPLPAPVAACIARRDAAGRMLDEDEGKALLAGSGLRVPRGQRVTAVEQAKAAAADIGFPVALKALGIAHKSEAGAVRLDLRDPAMVRAAAAELLPLGRGLFVEQMVQGAVAELIVGVVNDPLFGPVMTIGSGGVAVELLHDTATLLLPTRRDEIEAALQSLKLFPLLDGFRGRPRADLPAAIATIAGIADFALAASDIEELDINPLIVCAEGDGAWIADALIVLRERNEAPSSLGAREMVTAQATG